MIFKLSNSIKIGHQIKTVYGWRKVLEVTCDAVRIKEGLIRFGDTVYGWKSS